MLTCKVGNSTINTIDYEDEQLRKWHRKNILRCPICDNLMYYRNGEIKVAYFAHQPGSDCTDTILGSEPETEEHRQSIKDIYLFLKKQEGVSNIILERWISETKQRPDISFTYNNEKYVIEMQCSPLATKYLERHRLYQLAGIKDIWILGFDKYKGNLTVDGYFKTKTIERQLIYDTNQQLIYYNYYTKKFMIVTENNAMALLDRKTTFDLKFNKIDLNNISLNEIIAETSYKSNKKTIINLINYSIKKQCDIIKYNYYLKLINKKVLCYFEIEGKKYIIDYLPEYLNIKDYNELVNEYMNINIKPFIFLNYNLYQTIEECEYFNDCYKKGYESDLRYDDCINHNMFFVYNNKILFFAIDCENIDSDMNNITSKYRSDFYDKEYEYIINENYKKIINKDKIGETVQLYIDKIVCKSTVHRKFQTFDLRDLKFLKGNIINSKVIQLSKKYYNKLLKQCIEYTSLVISEYNNEVEKEKELFIQFKNIIKNKLDKNNIDYDLNYSIKFLDSNNNNVEFENLIYFQEADTKYIIYDDHLILHNNNGEDISKYDTNDFVLIELFNIQKYLNTQWVFVKNYYGVLNIEEIDNLYEKINYVYPKLINEDINLNFFYNNKHRKIKEKIKYYYLSRYNFIEITNALTKVLEKINNILDEKRRNLYGHIEEDKIYNVDDFKVENNQINKTISNVLYPITVRIKENNIEEGDFNIMLNPCFTIEDEDIGFQLWKLNDYVDVLYDLGIKNVHNIFNCYYINK